MKLHQSLTRINELMSVFVAQVKGATAMRQTDINQIAETILIPLFKEIYGYRNLKNLNYAESGNYPGIDLGDETARVAFQITSTCNSKKIKDTLRKFVEYKLYEKYDKLIIYILVEKQRTYSGSGYEEIIQDRFSFDKSKDIQDYRDLLKDISKFQIDITRKIEDILESNFGNGNVRSFGIVCEPQIETVTLNLLELFFPKTIYISELAIDRTDVINKSKIFPMKLNKSSSTRDVVRAALEQVGLKFGIDWINHEGKIVTFHDLNDEGLPLSSIIDRSTIINPSSREFYKVDESYERVFKSLLGRCLQQKLYHQRVVWQHQDQLFIFSDVEGEAKRVEQWYGKKKDERVVYERVIKENKPDEILYCKHLAFRTEYRLFGEQWYILIKPTWFFSHDGYRRFFYGADKIAWLKRQENNQAVFNHVRFITYFLKNNNLSDLFVKRHSYPFLLFGELIRFDSAPALDDNEWNPKDSKQNQANMEGFQKLSLPFDDEASLH